MFTRHGVILFEAVSALQKSIRRGLERDAFTWAVELASTHESYLWRRLTVIANEDIGLASPETVMLVNSQRAAWWDMREHGDDPAAFMILSCTVLAMCRAPKSRLSDHFLCAVVTKNGHAQPEVPDYALDKHTLRGKRMGRGNQHFIEVGAHLENAAKLDDPYAAEARANWLADKWPGLPELKKLKPTNGAKQARLLPDDD